MELRACREGAEPMLGATLGVFRTHRNRLPVKVGLTRLAVVTLAIVDAHSECGVRGINESRNRSSGDPESYAVIIVWAGAKRH
jgi:hypothetical protein